MYLHFSPSCVLARPVAFPSRQKRSDHFLGGNDVRAKLRRELALGIISCNHLYTLSIGRNYLCTSKLSYRYSILPSSQYFDTCYPTTRATPPSTSMSRRAVGVIGAAALGGAGYYFYRAGGDPKTAQKIAERRCFTRSRLDTHPAGRGCHQGLQQAQVRTAGLRKGGQEGGRGVGAHSGPEVRRNGLSLQSMSAVTIAKGLSLGRSSRHARRAEKLSRR